MRVKNFFSFLWLVFFLSLAIFVKASHISGGQITYKSLGNNVYEIKLTYFWDCQGGFNPGTSQIIDVDGCGQNLTCTVNQSTLTPGDGNNATGLCAGSTLSCKNMIEYIGTITLPAACNSWTFSIGSCCRGGNITNISSGTTADYYHFASLDNLNAPNNNSPQFTIPTLPYFCVNQQACFNLGVVEQDGNTLSYALVDAYQTSTTFVTYNAPYTGAQPIQGATIDPNTGQISFTPTTLGDFIFVVQITEKDANGNIIGTVMRDFQVVVINCSNQTTACNQGNITNVSAGNVPGGSANTLQICEGLPFCFDISFTDPNGTDSIFLTSPNIATALPGSTLTKTYLANNSIKATICWTPPAGSSGQNTNFSIVIKDNACPVPGTQYYTYVIDVLPSTTAGPDQTICGNQTATLPGNGPGTQYTWSVLSGAPIQLGTNFSCNPCQNPVASPNVTTTYILTTNGATNCVNKDTVTVFVVPDFTLTASANLTSACLNSSVQFTSSVSPPGSYTYSWSPATALTNTSIPNPTANYSVAGTYNYTLSATSSQGCKKQITNVSVTAQPVVTPVFTVVPTNTTICGSGTSTIQLNVNLGNSNPTSCGLTSVPCASTNTLTVGNGFLSNSSTGYPAIYGNWYKNSRHQMLIRASELSAAGVVPGKLSSIAFNISTINGTTTYPGFTIKLKCTSASDVGTAFDNTGLIQVYSGNITITTGWNVYQFSQPYEWDGVSNLLVDVCNALTSSYSNNSSSPYTATSYNSVLYLSSDVTVACGTTSLPTTSTNRPNMRFENCSSTPPANSYNYSWLPSAGLSSSTIQNPVANVNSSVVYTVVVTPTAAATCSASGTSTITVISSTTPTISPIGPFCSNASSQTLSALPSGGTWSLTASTSTAGIFTPSLATIGTNTVTYVLGGAGCMQTATTTVNIEKYIPSTITATLGPLCINGSTINLMTLPQFTTGIWSGTGVNGTVFDPSVSGQGSFVLTYSTNSSPTTTLCPSSSTINVDVFSVQQPSITPSGPFCNNFSVQTLSASPSGGIWSGIGISASGNFSPTQATIGTNTVSYMLTSGPCTAITTSTISVEKFISASLTSGMGPYCSYDPSVNLNTLPLNVGGTWSGAAVSGSSFSPQAASIGNNIVQYNTNSSTPGLCPDSTTMIIVVNPKPDVNALSDKQNGCEPLLVSFYTTNANNGNGVWDFGNQSPAANGLSAATIYNFGSYQATFYYTDVNGCKDTTQVAYLIDVFDTPDAQFDASTYITTIIDPEIKFTNYTSNLNNNTYYWTFGDTASSVDINPVHIYTETGTYEVVMIATSPEGCVDTTSRKIIINPDVVLWVPNAFTPGNHDGLNDVFLVELPPTGVDYSTFNFQIFDRWGELIFKTNDVTIGWNGSRNNSGPLLKEEVYVWKVFFYDNNKKYYEKVGHVTLIR